MKRGIVLVLGFLLVAGLAFPQKLRSPIKVATSPGHEARWSAMAFSADGIAHIVWEDNPPDSPNHTVQYVTYDGTKASTPINLKNQTGGNAHWPHITIGPSGLIAVVWGEEGNVYLRVYDPVKKAWLNTENVKSGNGEDEPCVAVDPQDNIYVWWFDSAAIVYTRCKIDGQWQDTFNMGPGARAKAGYIAAGRDGQVWAIWHEKGDDGNYKGLYRKRTATTPWTEARHINDAGASWSHSSIAVGPDNVPYVARGDVDESTGTNQEIWVLKLDEVSNPKTLAIPLFLQHFPRLAVDKNGVHVACAIGPGDTGWGVRYTNNIGGEYRPFQTFGAAWTKLPGIAVDGYGNVGVCWTSVRLNEGADIWLALMEPIKKRTAAAPKNPKGAIISHDVFESEYVYEFTWQANSANAPADLEGYRVYRQDAGADEPTLIASVPKTSLKAQYTTTLYGADTVFKVSTIMKSGLESDKVSFAKILLPTVPAPLTVKQEVIIDGANASQAQYNFSWKANPAVKAADLGGYRLYRRSNASAAWEFSTAIAKTSLTAQLTTTAYSAETQFAVVAVLTAGFESDRNPITAITTRSIALPKTIKQEVVLDGANASQAVYLFTWQTNPAINAADLGGYRLYKRGNASAGWALAAEIAKTSLSAQQKTTSYSAETQFTVVAVLTNTFESAKTPIASIKTWTMAAPLNARAEIVIDESNSAQYLYRLSWEANATNPPAWLEGYRVYRKLPGLNWTLVGDDITTPAASIPITTYNDGTQFGVTALHLGGVASARAPVTIIRPALLAPTNARAVLTLSGIKSNPMLKVDFTWTANTGSDDRFVAGYRIYQKEGGGAYTLIKTLAKSDLSWSFTYAGTPPKLQFGITTLSTLGIESPIAAIGGTSSGTTESESRKASAPGKTVGLD